MPLMAAETRVACRTGEAQYPLQLASAMKTYSAKPSDIEQTWYIVDAEGMVLGRLATEVARVIRGKHKPIFTPHMDTGDNVIVINASKVKVTGRKAEQKNYFRHTGYMGHERFTPYGTMIAKHPERVIEKAVYGMLPKTALGRQVLRRKLRVYATAEHPHVAQQPKTLTFNKSEK
jgi:large subunit ribosomal protein L13